MKKFKISTIVVIALMLTALLSSCDTKEENICNYNGTQIVEKKSHLEKRWIRVRKGREITNRIYLLDYDWNRFNIGDIVHCP